MTYAEELHIAHKERQARLAFLKPIARKAKPRIIPIINGRQTDLRDLTKVKRDWLRVATPEFDAPQYSVNHIQECVAGYFRLGKTELLSDSRSRKVVWPRQIAIYLSTKLTTYSSLRLGRLFGGRDHTTVLHARKQVEKRRLDDPEFAVQLVDIQAAIVGQPA